MGFHHYSPRLVTRALVRPQTLASSPPLSRTLHQLQPRSADSACGTPRVVTDTEIDKTVCRRRQCNYTMCMSTFTAYICHNSCVCVGGGGGGGGRGGQIFNNCIFDEMISFLQLYLETEQKQVGTFSYCSHASDH